MDDPKKFVLGKFFENVPKWSNSQSYHEKSHIWRLFNFFTSCRSSWLDTSNNFGRFFHKTLRSFYRDWCIRSTWYCILRLFSTFKTHSDQFRPSWLVLHNFFIRNFRQKLSFWLFSQDFQVKSTWNCTIEMFWMC